MIHDNTLKKEAELKFSVGISKKWKNEAQQLHFNPAEMLTKMLDNDQCLFFFLFKHFEQVNSDA